MGVNAGQAGVRELRQLGVFGFGGDQNEDVAASFFPDGEEILISGAGFGGIALQEIGAIAKAGEAS